MSQETNAWVLDFLIADADIAAITDQIMIAEPEDRPSLLEDYAAIIVLRPEEEQPDTMNSQGGARSQTIYIEIRSWTKQTVHDLKNLVLAALEDKDGMTSSGCNIYRVRHDWNRDPYMNADGKTWECQIRYVVWYRQV